MTRELADHREREAAVATPSGETIYPPAIREREWWVTWILDGAERKRPVAPWQTGHAYPVEWRNDLEEVDRPETDFEKAKRWTEFRLDELGLSLPDDSLTDELRLGIILPVDRPPRDERVVLIDWDDVRDPETGEIHPVAATFIEQYGGYVEISRSGEGLHQFVFGGLRHRDKFIAPVDDEPFVGDDLPQVEIYDGGRHVAMTGKHVQRKDQDLVDGQECIDEIVSQYADAELDAGYRTYDPETGATSTESTGHTESVSNPVPEPEPCEYEGPPIDELEASKPEDRSLAYHVVVEAFCEGYAGVLNWQLEGAAAALGQREDRTVVEILSDLRGDEREDGSVGYDKKTPGRIEYDYGRARRGEFEPASWETLASWGVLPSEFVEQITDSDAEPTATIPFAKLDVLSEHERERYARKRGIDWPSTEEARDRLEDSVFTAMENEEMTVAAAPTSLGKSYVIDSMPWNDHPEITGGQPVVKLSGTKPARDESIERSKNAGVSTGSLRAADEVCPVAGGDHDPEAVERADEDRQVITVDGEPASDWFHRQTREKQIPASVAHRKLEAINDQFAQLPCCGGQGNECELETQWTGVPRDGNGDPTFDVVHATHPFAHVPSLVAHTNVVFDEQPDFTIYKYGDSNPDDPLTQERLRRAVTAYLAESDKGPSTFEEYVAACHELATYSADPYNEHAAPDDRAPKALYDETRLAAGVRLDSPEPDIDWYFDHVDAHALSKALTRALYYAIVEEGFDANERASATVTHEPPRYDAHASDDPGWNREWVTITVDRENCIRRVRDAPDLSMARSVIGLDARPNPYLWQQNVHPSMTVDLVLDPMERQLWRRYERGLTTVVIGDAIRPAGPDGEYLENGSDGTRANIEYIRSQTGDEFRTAITASAFEDELEEIMLDAGVDDPELMHFGEEESRNDFGAESVGYVEGCIDPGDDYVLDMLAECGLEATPALTDEDCDQCRSRGCRGCQWTGKKREHGREFEGPDAEAAASLLASVRKAHVAQSVGRWARNPDDPDDRATVFVRTSAIPSDLVDYRVPDAVWTYGEKQREIVRRLRDRAGGVTFRELAEDTDSTAEHVRRTITRLAEHGAVTLRRGEGPNGATLAYADGTWKFDDSTVSDRTAGAATVSGVVSDDLVDVLDEVVEERSNSRVWDTYTWELAIRVSTESPSPRDTSGGALTTPATSKESHPPP